MIPVSLKLSNFTSYGDNVPQLDFTKFHLAAISGSNGAGKSSILDAITWALWGWSRAGDSSDQLVRLGASDMQVEFSFALDAHTYIIKRRRALKSGGSTALELWSGTHNLTEGTIKSTQEKIINLLHLSFETFTNSSFLRQGHADEFTTKGPTDRKRILADILGLAHYDLLEEKAKEKVKEADNKLKLLEYQLLEIEAELSQKEERQKRNQEATKKVSETENLIKLLEEEIKILQKERETINLAIQQREKLSQNLTNQEKELEQIITQGKERAERIKILEEQSSKLPEIDKKLEGSESIKKEIQILSENKDKRYNLETQLSNLRNSLNLKIQKKNILQKNLEELEQELNKLSQPGAKCPTCGQEIGTDQKHKVKTDLELKIKNNRKEISEIETQTEEEEIKKIEVEISKINFDEDQLNNLQKKLDEFTTLQKQRETILQSKASLDTEKSTRQELLVLYQNKKAQVELLKQDFQKSPQIDESSSSVFAKLEIKEKELTQLRTEDKEARTILGQTAELISRVEQMEKLSKQKIEERSQHQKEKVAYEELALAFGKKGIQAMIIETAIPEIEDEANNLLGRLTNGRMKVRFETQKETKTKVETSEGKMHAVVETLDIIISDEMGERPYENYSGGEQFRVNVAIRLALSKLLTRRAGAKLQFLVLDEGFGTQDVEGRTKIVEVLDTIKNDFEKILVITHLDELKEEFPTRIEVSKNSGGSTFQVVGN